MSGTQNEVRYSCWKLFFTLVGLPLFLLDIGLDVFAAVSFYQEKDYMCLGLLVLFLVVSTVLVQVYSWLWYSYDDFNMQTKVEKLPSWGLLGLLHVFQLGIYVRHAGVLEMSIKSYRTKTPESAETARDLNHDLNVLRIIETFSESAPQLALMFTIILRKGQLDPVTVLKAVGSVSAIALSVTTYHRSVCSYLPEEKKQNKTALVIYFIWNLVLISSRLAALALFASVLPCFIFTHFICSWLVLFFFAWRSKTKFMESPGGKWLYRATLGLIWYFNWFNGVEGNTGKIVVLYHGYILTDISILCGVWCWKMSTDPPDFVIQPSYALLIAVCVVEVYTLGLLITVIYYKFFHQNVDEHELIGDSTEQQAEPHDSRSKKFKWYLFRKKRRSKMACFMPEQQLEQPVTPPEIPAVRRNKRMRKLAMNFYS